MGNKNFLLGLLVILLVLGMAIVGCNNGTTDGESDTWSNVTSLSQLEGTWKAPSSANYSIDGIKVTVKYTNYTVTFDPLNKTMSASGSFISTYSGGKINEYWPYYKGNAEYMNSMEGVTVTINDANHSITQTSNNFSVELSDAEINMFQINQDETKLKIAAGEGIQVIYTNQ